MTLDPDDDPDVLLLAWVSWVLKQEYTRVSAVDARRHHWMMGAGVLAAARRVTAALDLPLWTSADDDEWLLLGLPVRVCDGTEGIRLED